MATEDANSATPVVVFTGITTATATLASVALAAIVGTDLQTIDHHRA